MWIMLDGRLLMPAGEHNTIKAYLALQALHRAGVSTAAATVRARPGLRIRTGNGSNGDEIRACSV
jgi:hypothetical protein